MAQRETILEKTMEAGRAAVLIGMMLMLFGGGIVASSVEWGAIGWAIGVVGVTALLYGLVTVHAATTEVMVRSRLVDLGARRANSLDTED